MINIAALIVSLLAAPAAAIEPGTYTLHGRILSDVGISQPIELKNFRARSNVAGSFDVRISTDGGLMRFPEDSQVVQGIYHGNEFMFVIPFANVTNVTSYKFIFTNKETDGKYVGRVEIYGEQKGDTKEGPFKFTLVKQAR